MRASFLAVTFLAAITATSAFGQQAAPKPAATPPQAMPKSATAFMSHKDIMALIKKAKADRKPDKPVTAEPILQLAPYKAQLEYRPAKAPAAVHEKDAELMVVLRGKGNILTDGKMVNEKRVNSANLTGSDIEGGVSHNVVKGDTILIPANTPHQVIPAGKRPIVLMTMHVPFPAEGWPPKN